MAPETARANLRNILADFYPSEAATRRVASDAGLNHHRISFSGAAVDTWHSILREAELSQKQEDLFAVVLSEYGQNQKLTQAIDAYRSLASQEHQGSPTSSPKPPTEPYSTPNQSRRRLRLSLIALVLTAAIVAIGYGALNIFGRYSDPEASSITRLFQPTDTTIPPTPTATATPAPTSAPTSAPTPIDTSTPRPDETTASHTTQTIEANRAGSQATLTAIAQKADAAATSILAQILTPEPSESRPVSTWTNPKDNATYVVVPAGEFTMGEGRDELPVHIGEFWIMQTEVTNSHYARCVEAGACTEPQNERWNDNAHADHPVTHVDWQQAAAYAGWVGGRLPTEAEWEKACRGEDAREFPWGNEEPAEDLLNFNHEIGDTTPVGHYSPQGDSPYAIADMAGNVWEWTADWHDDVQVERTLRGGSFGNSADSVRCSYRFGYPPNSRREHYGFRVVLSSSP